MTARQFFLLAAVAFLTASCFLAAWILYRSAR